MNRQQEQNVFVGTEAPSDPDSTMPIVCKPAVYSCRSDRQTLGVSTVHPKQSARLRFYTARSEAARRTISGVYPVVSSYADPFAAVVIQRRRSVGRVESLVSYPLTRLQ